MSEADGKREAVTIRPSRTILRGPLLEQVGHRCGFPDCNVSKFLELAHIRAETPGGPRYDPTAQTGPGTANIIVLCSNHHRLIDSEPHRFSVSVLQEMRTVQLNRAILKREAGQQEDEQQETASQIVGLSGALQVWHSHASEASEGFWHRLFENVPELLAAAVPGDTVQLGSKCYVGGKTVHNKDGNIVDFLYKNRSTTNVTLVEIKRPGALLLGEKYRGTYIPSGELIGSVMQAADYRDQLQKNYYALVNGAPESFEVFNPRALVVIGNLAAEDWNAEQRRSFDLFRYGLRDTIIITFDELFQKVRDLVWATRSQ